MARANSNKLYRNFQKGLITEASFLNYPENACTDMDNVMISYKGNLYRRPGMNYDANASLVPIGMSSTNLASWAFTSFLWESVANESTRNFEVQQVGSTLHFFDVSVSPLSSGKKSFTVNLLTSLASGYTSAQAANEPVQMACGKGFLFVVSKAIYPTLVEYRPDTDQITTTRVYIQVRDFDGIDDGLANDEEPTTLSNAHKYNLYNQGWLAPNNDGTTGNNVQQFDYTGQIITRRQPPDPQIGSYFTHATRYPSNVQQWWVAKDNTGDFDPVKLRKFSFGQSKAPRGRYILDAFNKDRSNFSGITGLAPEVANEQPRSVSFFSGRVWYVSGSTVYFSQILNSKYQAGKCHQEADPTAEDISDLVDSDGGVIQIPEMVAGCKLVPAGVGILVFGQNGLWFISGGQTGFTATTISIQRIYHLGTTYPFSVVETKDGVLWVSDVGIQMMSIGGDSTGSAFGTETISEATINDFFVTKFPAINRPYIKGVFDKATSTVMWLFNDTSVATPWIYNRILCFDMKLKAFYPHSFTIGNTRPQIISAFNTTVPSPVNHPNNTSVKDMFLKFVFAVPNAGVFDLTFGYLRDYTYADWKSFNNVGYDYLSFLESGYELMDDAMRDKGANYLFTYFRRTEKNFINNNDDLTFDYPSSCLFQAKWDWADRAHSGRWSEKFEAYRYTRLPINTTTDLEIQFGFPIIVTKNKVRGNGRALQFRFESNGIGQDFDLLGWAVPYYGNTIP